MKVIKGQILENICYTKLVYDRINKKLRTNSSEKEIKELIINIIEITDENYISKIGKNYYLANTEHNIKITINSNTYRVITVNRII